MDTERERIGDELEGAVLLTHSSDQPSTVAARERGHASTSLGAPASGPSEPRWARSGAMLLTGDSDGPPLAPATDVAVVVDEALAPFGLDARVLAERAAHRGLTRSGRRSCGGATRLVEAADGWLALSLARPDDVASLPALIGVEPSSDPWPDVEATARSRSAGEVVDQAVLLGMAAAVVGDVAGGASDWSTGTARSGATNRPSPRVLDLSALWAGPLCTHLLGRSGAEVIKVESWNRPDGVRSGVASFSDLLNHAKASVALDFTAADGRAALHDLVDSVDIVVASSRQRAVSQLGLDPDRFLAGGTDRVWVAITGHGWGVDRIGFGDDAAVDAGLVAWPSDGHPRFVGDAIADPLCGALAARRAFDAWQAGGRWFIDASLVGAAAQVVPAGGTGVAVAAESTPDRDWVLDGMPVAAPERRSAPGPAATLGADTARVLREMER